MQFYSILFLYCVVVAIASLAGGILPNLVKLTHRRMQLMMSFVGGLMLGVALLHLLPHSLAEQGSIDRSAAWTLGGLLTMFLLIRVFHVHAHEHGDTSDVVDHHHHDHDHEGGPPLRGRPESGPTCNHAHHDHEGGPPLRGRPESGHTAQHPFSWLGLALGLSLHTLIDGVALGAAVAAEARHQQYFALYGLGTFLAVALHKPLDALSITSLMAAGGWKKNDVLLANVAFAVMCPLGAIAFVTGLAGMFADQNVAIGCALAFAAGVFLCISLADLLPEVAFHAHDRINLTLALFLGIALAWVIGFLEPAHTHHQHDHAAQARQHVPGIADKSSFQQEINPTHRASIQ